MISDRTLRLVGEPSHAAAVEDIEELPDWFLHRPVARRVVDVLLPTAVTPNQITMGSGVVGVLASVSLGLGATRPVLRLVSAGLLFGSVVLDCVDGQLARARKTMSPGGTALDTVVDVLVSLSIVLAATYVLDRQSESQWLWVLAPVTLASYAAQCFFFDVAKERYLAGHGLRYASSKSVLADQGVAGARSGPSGRVFRRLFDQYWSVARRLTVETPRTSGAGETMSPLHMRACTWLGQGTHMALLYTAAAVSYFWIPALYVCFLVVSTVMNAMMFFLIFTGTWAVRS